MAIINNLTDVWNGAGTLFTAIKMQVTNTASAAGSKVIDLLVDGASKFSVDTAGGTTVNSLIVSGNISAPAWTTTGLRFRGIPATLTDTTSTGTVPVAYTDSFGGNTIAAASATTFTNYLTAQFKDPIAGANTTMTGKWALGADSFRAGAAGQFSVSNAGVVTLPAGQVVNGVTLTNAGLATNYLTAAGTYAAAAGSGGTPGGASGTVQGNTAGAFAGIPGFTYDTTSGALTTATGTITANQPALTATQIWNNAAIAFKGAVLNVTDTASSTNSNLLSLQVGGVERVFVSKRGSIQTTMSGTTGDVLFGFSTTGNASNNGFNTGIGFADLVTNGNYGLRAADNRGVEIPLALCYGFANIGAALPDTRVYRGAAGRVDICTTGTGVYGDLKLRTLFADGGTVTASAPVLDLAQTWNNAAVAFSGIKFVGNVTAALNNSRYIDIRGGASGTTDVFVVTANSLGESLVNARSYGANQEFRINNNAALVSASGFVVASSYLGIGGDIGASNPDVRIYKDAANVARLSYAGTTLNCDLKLRNLITSAGVIATDAAAPTIVSATSIAPTTSISFVSGTVAIATITPPSPISAGGGQITLVPTGAWATTTAGNIANAITATPGVAINLIYDTTAAKWYSTVSAAAVATGNFKSDGTVPMTGAISSTVGTMISTVADGATAKGFALNTLAYTTAGAKLLSVQNNGVEKAFVDKDGLIVADSFCPAGLSNPGVWAKIYWPSGGQDMIMRTYAKDMLVVNGQYSVVSIPSDVSFGFTPSANIQAAQDTRIYRGVAGRIDICQTSNTVYGDVKLRNLIVDNVVNLRNFTVATLPSAVTSGSGAQAYVTDALTPTYNTVVMGGGAIRLTVTSDGTNWKS